MNAVLSKYLAPLTLLEWGGIMLYFYLSGRIVAFLHPMFWPLVLVVGILLTGTSLVLFFTGGESCSHTGGEHGESSCDHHHAGDEGHTHDHAEHEEHAHTHDHAEEDEGHVHVHGKVGFGRALSFFILLLPIAVAAMYSPDSYGANLLRNRALVTSASALPALQNSAMAHSSTSENASGGNSAGSDAAGSPQEVNVSDLLFAAEDASTRDTYDGKQVEMIGQVVHGNEADHEKGPFQLVRFLMVCCAADVRPMAVKVNYSPNASDFESMSWVKVVGKIKFQPVGGAVAPVLDPTSVDATDIPADPYIY